MTSTKQQRRALQRPVAPEETPLSMSLHLSPYRQTHILSSWTLESSRLPPALSTRRKDRGKSFYKLSWDIFRLLEWTRILVLYSSVTDIISLYGSKASNWHVPSREQSSTMRKKRCKPSGLNPYERVSEAWEKYKLLPTCGEREVAPMTYIQHPPH